MVSREAMEMTRRWLEGAQRLNDLPPREAAALFRKMSLERCLWVRLKLAEGHEEIAGVAIYESLKTEQRLLLGLREKRKTSLN